MAPISVRCAAADGENKWLVKIAEIESTRLKTEENRKKLCWFLVCWFIRSVVIKDNAQTK